MGPVRLGARGPCKRGSPVARKIFISYRREDSAAHALNIAQDLERAFCGRSVFIDIDRIRPGQPFAAVLENYLAASKVMLVIIGPNWLDMRDEKGQRRLDDAADWVRLEIGGALARRLTVIPVLVGGAKLPQKASLPEMLQPLVDQHAAIVNHATFRNDIAGLRRDVRAALGWPWGWPCPVKRATVAAAIVGAFALAAALIDRVPGIFSETVIDAAARPICDGVEIKEAGATRCLKPNDAFRGLRVFKDCVDVCPEMVVLSSGPFTMGSPKDERERSDNEGPQRKVRIARPFAVGRFAVTRAQFEVFVRESGHAAGDSCSVYRDDLWRMETGRNFRDPGFDQEDSHPVVCVNWNDANAYVTWLSRKTGKHYRLLSEAEREYATRALSPAPFWWGDRITTSQANYNGTYPYGGAPSGEWRKKTLAVNSFTFNPWGLYQVHGNAYEWLQDCEHDGYQGAPADGTAWTTGACEFRAVRGGSWFSRPKYLRSAHRESRRPDLRVSDVGFRVARDVDDRP